MAGSTGEEDGVDDGGRQAHQARQHREGCREVVPVERQFGVNCGELQNDNEESEETAEAPGEHAPRPVWRTIRLRRCHQAETHAGDDDRQDSDDPHRLGDGFHIYEDHDWTG